MDLKWSTSIWEHFAQSVSIITIAFWRWSILNKMCIFSVSQCCLHLLHGIGNHHKLNMRHSLAVLWLTLPEAMTILLTFFNILILFILFLMDDLHSWFTTLCTVRSLFFAKPWLLLIHFNHKSMHLFDVTEFSLWNNL